MRNQDPLLCVGRFAHLVSLLLLCFLGGALAQVDCASNQTFTHNTLNPAFFLGRVSAHCVYSGSGKFVIDARTEVLDGGALSFELGSAAEVDFVDFPQGFALDSFRMSGGTTRGSALLVSGLAHFLGGATIHTTITMGRNSEIFLDDVQLRSPLVVRNARMRIRRLTIHGAGLHAYDGCEVALEPEARITSANTGRQENIFCQNCRDFVWPETPEPSSLTLHFANTGTFVLNNFGNLRGRLVTTAGTQLRITRQISTALAFGERGRLEPAAALTLQYVTVRELRVFCAGNVAVSLTQTSGTLARVNVSELCSVTFGGTLAPDADSRYLPASWTLTNGAVVRNSWPLGDLRFRSLASSGDVRFVWASADSALEDVYVEFGELSANGASFEVPVKLSGGSGVGGSSLQGCTANEEIVVTNGTFLSVRTSNLQERVLVHGVGSQASFMGSVNANQVAVSRLVTSNSGTVVISYDAHFQISRPVHWEDLSPLEAPGSIRATSRLTFQGAGNRFDNVRVELSDITVLQDLMLSSSGVRKLTSSSSAKMEVRGILQLESGSVLGADVTFTLPGSVLVKETLSGSDPVSLEGVLKVGGDLVLEGANSSTLVSGTLELGENAQILVSAEVLEGGELRAHTINASEGGVIENLDRARFTLKFSETYNHSDPFAAWPPSSGSAPSNTSSVPEVILLPGSHAELPQGGLFFCPQLPGLELRFARNSGSNAVSLDFVALEESWRLGYRSDPARELCGLREPSPAAFLRVYLNREGPAPELGLGLLEDGNRSSVHSSPDSYNPATKSFLQELRGALLTELGLAESELGALRVAEEPGFWPALSLGLEIRSSSGGSFAKREQFVASLESLNAPAPSPSPLSDLVKTLSSDDVEVESVPAFQELALQKGYGFALEPLLWVPEEPPKKKDGSDNTLVIILACVLGGLCLLCLLLLLFLGKQKQKKNTQAQPKHVFADVQMGEPKAASEGEPNQEAETV